MAHDSPDDYDPECEHCDELRERGWPANTTLILPAEWVGRAAPDPDGKLRIGYGDDVVLLDVDCAMDMVYVRRSSRDLSIMEIHICHHDGLAQEEMDEQNRQAELYPLGPKEYWRSHIVGNWTTGRDGHTMTDDDFEEYWAEGEG